VQLTPLARRRTWARLLPAKRYGLARIRPSPGEDIPLVLESIRSTASAVRTLPLPVVPTLIPLTTAASGAADSWRSAAFGHCSIAYCISDE